MGRSTGSSAKPVNVHGRAYSPCARHSMAGLGAEVVLKREFDFVIGETGEIDSSQRFNEVVAEFPGDSDAKRAYTTIRDWFDVCMPPGAETYKDREFTPVPVGPRGSAEERVSAYGPVDTDLDPHGCEGWFLETVSILVGDRIAVLTRLMHGQDYNWADGTPVTQMLPKAAQRL